MNQNQVAVYARPAFMMWATKPEMSFFEKLFVVLDSITRYTQQEFRTSHVTMQLHQVQNSIKYPWTTGQALQAGPDSRATSIAAFFSRPLHGSFLAASSLLLLVGGSADCIKISHTQMWLPSKKMLLLLWFWFWFQFWFCWVLLLFVWILQRTITADSA